MADPAAISKSTAIEYTVKPAIITWSDFAANAANAGGDISTFIGKQIVQGVRARILFRVPPAQVYAWGVGLDSFGGVRTSQTYQINIHGNTNADGSGTDVPNISCDYVLGYVSPNRDRTTELIAGKTEFVAGSPTTENPYNHIPQNAASVSAFSYMSVDIYPHGTPQSSGANLFYSAASAFVLPVTRYDFDESTGV